MPVVLLLFPLLAAIFLSLFFRKVGERLASAIRGYPTLKIALPMAIMIFGAISAVCLDLLDVSEILFQDRDLLNERVVILNKNLEVLHRVSEPNLTAIRSEITNIVESLKPSQTENTKCLLALVVGVTGGLCFLISVYGAAAEHQLTQDLKESEGRVLEAKTRAVECQSRFDAACQLLAQLGTVVGAKQRRIKRLIGEKAALATCEHRLHYLCSALSPTDQLQAIVTCAHEFFWKKNTPNLKLRVVLYMPEENHLVAKASTDGHSLNVITSPNTKHRHFFVVNGESHGCVTTEAFRVKKPIVIANCETHTGFRAFTEAQKNRMKSLFACPLLHGNDDNLGVLVADSNISNFFDDKPEFRLLLEQMGSEIALRLMLENTMKELLDSAQKNN